MRILLCLVAIGVSALCINAQTVSRNDEKAARLLEKATTKLQQLDAITLTISGIVRDQRPKRIPETRFEAQVKLMRPNFARIEYQEIRRNADGITKQTYLVIANGRTIWKFNPEKNEYLRGNVSADGTNIPDVISQLGMPLYMFFNSRVPHTLSAPLDAGIEKWNGQDYHVVEFRDGQADEKGVPMIYQRIYFDEDNLVHRFVNEQLHRQYIAEITLRDICVSASLSAADFVYALPETARDITTKAELPPLLAPGTVAPDFTVMDREGKSVSLSDYRGKIVVLDFWSTGCGRCLESREHFNSIAARYARDVVFLAVHVWDPKEAFDVWLPKHPQFSSLRFVMDPAEYGNDIATKLYQVSGLPTHYVIGRDGRIVKGFLGYSGPASELEKTIQAAGGRSTGN